MTILSVIIFLLLGWLLREVFVLAVALFRVFIRWVFSGGRYEGR